MVISLIWPDIRQDFRLFSVSGILPNIPPVKSGILPDTGYKKKAGLSGRISGASLNESNYTLV
jgi:hypothetical protein